MDLQDFFQPYEKLVEIDIVGRKCSVPENNTLLRGFQFLSMETISYGDFCWNGDCLNCQVWIKNGDKEKGVISCRTNASDGMEIVRMSDEIELEF
ncbi:MAG TPA: 2Fe-2S iron-sulfur cluster-binding protein [Pyrinomonadaceae bacterium]|nr:2Fe-2S iron-sulfur cluster-binding protein [Pyrinomonadaceae bacterium]